MIPEITFGQHIRVVLDVGCGVASFGAYLLSRNVVTMSVAPKDVHENQIQFALERGVPAMVAAFATRRLLYPSQAFDLVHCSRCRINWTRDDGILLLEVNRMLRAGGYFVWAAQPVYKHEEILEQQWEEMLNLTTRLCWKFLKKDGYIAVWQKPSDNSCYINRKAGTKPPLCDPNDDPDSVWYVDLKACISELPKDGYGANVTEWPSRLQTPPDRLKTINLRALSSRSELFKAESKDWKEIIAGYVRALPWKTTRLRNIMDMRAGFGGFAAALIQQKFESWVMNVVPVSGPNTLPVIYDRGLIGVVHDWCEAFDTYPRTYDLLHAANLLSVERKRNKLFDVYSLLSVAFPCIRCNVSSIMLEMDRILRPGGRVYIRDSLEIMDELQQIAKAIGWHVMLRDTEEGPHASYRVLVVLCHTKVSVFSKWETPLPKFAHCYFNSLPSFLRSHIKNANGYFSEAFETLVDCNPLAFIFFHLVLQTVIAAVSLSTANQRFQGAIMNTRSMLDTVLNDILQVVTPLQEDWQIRFTIINDLRSIVESVESLRGATVEPFGSFVSNLFTRWGDLDISIELSNGLHISSAGKKQKQTLLLEVLKALRMKGKVLILEASITY
ncbi:unnamed protein product [Sphenostylis stenocarpa]|uniref:Methyltransferase n=1 Tax=Sphenostylis stenocarpa TaxID=92480 RepID=A0AA86V6L2_9FABA|nr:unnamed protein product [Sphenostylis stenocarpa]